MHSAFWAKSSGLDQAWPYKPVAHHIADVAACALRFLEHNPARLAREARLSGLTPSAHARFCALAAALHDIGKISKSFQFIRPAHWPSSVLGACPASMQQSLRHWQATALLLNASELRASLSPVFGPDGLPSMLTSAIAGHHGVAPCADLLDDGDTGKAARHPGIGPECVIAAAALTAELVFLFDDLRDLHEIVRPEALSFALNGLITLADWVGSDESTFGFVDPAIPLADYWPLALRRADDALASKGLLPARPVATPSLAAISAHAGSPRPMQALAGAAPMLGEPTIVVIEDGTGSGKTEAALLLAGRMMAAGLGEGLFVALPTMATANAMHGRLDAAIGALFDGEASLVLAHGKADIASRLRHLAAVGQGNEHQSEVRSWFNAWIADSRKRAFFASAGAGTIDQAFLSILPKKHLTMRQYALAGRILIIDEAHACDAYMGEELKTLAEMQARLGGSMIILSATLGRRARADLVKAFALGRGVHPQHMRALEEQVRSGNYPLFTRWSRGGGVERIAVDGDPLLARSVAITRIEKRADVVRLALDAAALGAAVAIICNAVDPAIDTFEALLAAGHHPDRCHLFHARFTVEDRLGIEKNVQARFGRDSTSEARAGRILVATQVIEQSLDVDFDLMFSDLAPADLIVQRAGRLWRHDRPQRPQAEPVLHLLSPDPGAVTEARWLEATLGPASFVYEMPGVMWRTARDLLASGRLDTPGDLRRLIETAYDMQEDDLPEPLRSGHSRSVGTGFAEQALGKRNTIDPSRGYIELTAPSADEDVGTRLGEKSLTIRLGRRKGGALVPLCRRDGADDRLNWALSEVTVRDAWFRRGKGGALPLPDDEATVAAVRLCWPEWERNIPLYEVDSDGFVLASGVERLSYSGKTGLRRHRMVV